MHAVRSRKHHDEWYKYQLPKLKRKGSHKPSHIKNFGIEDIVSMTKEEFENIPFETHNGREILYLKPDMLPHPNRNVIINIGNHAFIRARALKDYASSTLFLRDSFGRYHCQVEHKYNFKLVHYNGK